MLSKNRFLYVLFLVFVFGSCTKTTNDNNAAAITPSYVDYYSIEVGQSILYRLDSVVLLPFGKDTVTHSYWQKDSVMNVSKDLTDNLLYTVNSYIKPYTGNQDWIYLTSYRVTPKNQVLEIIGMDNLRFIKLASPVVDNFSWDGNSYFMKDYTPSSNDPLAFYQNWNYQYTHTDSSMVLTTGTFLHTTTVKEIDDSTGIASDPSAYYARSLATESYAKGIGLIHSKLLYLIWQPNTGYQTGSYGIELTRVQQ
ncbi:MULTISPECIES: hypothetical protein [Chitinophagaceae]